MKRSSTPSFIVEYKILPNKSESAFLKKMFFCGNRLQNILVNYASKQLKLMHESKEYRDAYNAYKSVKASKDDAAALAIKEAAKEKLNAVIQSFHISDYELQHFLSVGRQKYKKYLHSDMTAKLASNVASGVNEILYKDGKQLHHKKLFELRTLSCKKNSGIVLDAKNRIVTIQKRITLPIKVRKKDAFAILALEQKVKYCNLVRKPGKSGWQYYIQVVFEGTPPAKYDYRGNLRYVKSPDCSVGIDPGVSTIAATNNKECIFFELAPDIQKFNSTIVDISEKAEHKRRANNPQNYNEDGTISKGKKIWINTNNSRRIQLKLANAYRRRAAYVKESHGHQANLLLRLGSSFLIEKMNYKALAKRSTKETEHNEKTGKCKSKKRFGKSIDSHAPAAFKETLKRKATVIDVNTQKLKASQYNHITDTYNKKKLNQRYVKLDDDKIQRDLYSAFVILNCTDTLDSPDKEKCVLNYLTFKKSHDELVQSMKKAETRISANFGLKELIS